VTIPLAKNKNTGVTLLELLVTIFIAVAAVGIIFNGYTLIVRLWNNYTHKVEASAGAWATYLKIHRMMSEARGIKKTTEAQWVFYKSGRDSCELSYRNNSLVSSDSVLLFKNVIDSFSLDCADTGGLYPIWQCGFVFSYGRRLSGMNWRTAVGGNELDTVLPTPMKLVSWQGGLYWDEKNK
jgi:Tfp pilus assembly protein PilE